MSTYPGSGAATALSPDERSGDEPISEQPSGEQPASKADRRLGPGRIWLAVGLAVLLAVAVLVGLILDPGLSSRPSGGKTPTAGPQLPYSPAQVRVAASGGAIVVSWVPQGSGFVGFRIYRAQNQGGPYDIIGEVSSPIFHSFTDSSALQVGSAYWYRVTAFNRIGESRPSAAAALIVAGGRSQGASGP